MRKTLKFAPGLAEMIVDGRKFCTWRVGDEKELEVFDEFVVIDNETGHKIGVARITECYPKTFGTLILMDHHGHEEFESEEDMYETYQSYYPNHNVGPDTELKIIRFAFNPK
jgi:hypothetical protein